MKKILRKFTKQAVAAFHAAYAPYVVVNAELKKDHYCWSWKTAQEWLSCYDAANFGQTTVYSWKWFKFNFVVFAAKTA